MRYIVGFLIAIGLIILAFILILRGGSNNPVNTPQSVTRYANTDVVMQLTIDGPINANQSHHQVRITVGQSQVVMAVLSGYEGQVVNSKSYNNNSTAYYSFLAALEHAGYSKGNNSAAIKNESGYCPSGDRYIYEILDGAQDVQRYWHTSCGQGNYQGNAAITNNLFQAQIPTQDYSNLTANVQL